MKVVYLGLSGVLHPSASLYKWLHRGSPWDRGHTEFECVSTLEAALDGWPEVGLVLTSTLPRIRGMSAVLEGLGPALAGRIRGVTFDDITTKAKRRVTTQGGEANLVGYSPDDYWRMDKSEIVRVHVEWLRPDAWIAIDDEDIRWSAAVRDDRLVLTDGCVGLGSKASQARLRAVMLANFGGC